MTDWGVGKIDKVYQTNRQGVGFSTPLELTSNNTLPNREQFNSIWLRKYA